MSDQCCFCEGRIPTNHLVLNGGELWLEFCQECGGTETFDACGICGGTNSDAIDNRLKAINKLNYIHRVIGQNYADLMHHIVGQGFTIKQYSMLSKTKPRKVSRLLREALYFTAEPLGLTKTRHTIRA